LLACLSKQELQPGPAACKVYLRHPPTPVHHSCILQGTLQRLASLCRCTAAATKWVDHSLCRSGQHTSAILWSLGVFKACLDAMVSHSRQSLASSSNKTSTMGLLLHTYCSCLCPSYSTSTTSHVCQTKGCTCCCVCHLQLPHS